VAAAHSPGMSDNELSPRAPHERDVQLLIASGEALHGGDGVFEGTASLMAALGARHPLTGSTPPEARQLRAEHVYRRLIPLLPRVADQVAVREPLFRGFDGLFLIALRSADDTVLDFAVISQIWR
jgi:hypothetical protein